MKLLIVDEVSMVSSLTLLYVHLRLTEIMCNDDLFGGISVLFSLIFYNYRLLKATNHSCQ